LIAFYSIQPWTKKGKVNKPTDLFLLPNEMSAGVSQSKADTFMKRRAKFLERINLLKSIPIGQAKKLSIQEHNRVSLSANVNA